MSDKYKCGTCGVVTDEKANLCKPVEITSNTGSCGFDGDLNAMCDSIKDEMHYICDTCGQPAENADGICSPRMLL